MINKTLLLEMNIRELFKKYPFIIEVFRNYGLKCRECMFAERVTLEEALESSKLPSQVITDEVMKCLDCEFEG